MSASKLKGKPDEMLVVTCDGLVSYPGGVAILVVALCYRNREPLSHVIVVLLYLWIITHIYQENAHAYKKSVQKVYRINFMKYCSTLDKSVLD